MLSTNLQSIYDPDDENDSIDSKSMNSINSINSNNTTIAHENTDYDKDDTMNNNISISSSLNVNDNDECTTLNNEPSSDTLFLDYVIFLVQDTSLNLTSDNNIINYMVPGLGKCCLFGNIYGHMQFLLPFWQQKWFY